MLAMADQHGYVAASVPGLADRARVSMDACLAALAAFQEPDEWSRTKENEGRRIAEVDGGWTLLNHAKYRAARAVDERRAYMRELMAKRRALASVSNVSNVSPCKPKQKQKQKQKDQKKEPVRGSRLPQGWVPSNELEAWAKAERPDLAHPRELASFSDYWRGVAGSKGVKLDWDATYRNWIRRANGTDRGPIVGRPVNTAGTSPAVPVTKRSQAEADAALARFAKEVGYQEPIK